MQVKRKSRSRRITPKTILVFLGIIIVAYLPLSTFIFSLKNDAFTGYFPSKFYISEAVNNKSMPWWNPFINFGLPQYGDMNSGFWSPITWFVALLFKYNAYSFTIELLFYIFLSGIGMYQLCRSYRFTKTVSYIAGISYLCSGFMVAHLQHFNWISAAAFLPWCIWAYNQLINKFSLKNNVICAFIFYLFLSSAHPGMIIGFIYYFVAYAVFFYFQKRNEDPESFRPKSFLRKNAWMLGLLLILSFGMIVGYADIIPFMTRGKKIESLSLIINPFSFQSIISFLFPLATVKGDAFFSTDISMRNAYFGLTLLLFFITGIRQNKSNYQKFFLYTGLFFLILSLGGVFKYVTCTILPLVGYVRLSGTFLIFTLFSFILFAAFALNNYIIEKKNFSDEYRKTFYALQLVMYTSLAAGIIGIAITQNSFIFHFSSILSAPGLSGKLKMLVDHFSIFDALLIQAFIQLGFWNAIKSNLKNRTYKELIKLVAIEMILATLLNIPFTGVGQKSLSDVDRTIKKSPDGLRIPYRVPIYSLYPTASDRYNKLVGDWSFYSKQIGVDTKAFYPVELNVSKTVFKDSLSCCCDKPYLFGTGDSCIQEIKVNYYKGNFIDLTVYNNKTDTLVYQQNIYPHWICTVNSESRKPIAYKGVFNAVKLEPGKNYVKFSFVPGSVMGAFDFSKYALLLCLIYLLIMMFKRPSP